MVEDVIAVAQKNLLRLKPQSPYDVRAAGTAIAQFSPALRDADKSIKSFLYTNMYRHPEVMRVRDQAAGIVRDLFDAYVSDPHLMGGHWIEGVDGLVISLALFRPSSSSQSHARSLTSVLNPCLP